MRRKAKLLMLYQMGVFFFKLEGDIAQGETDYM